MEPIEAAPVEVAPRDFAPEDAGYTTPGVTAAAPDDFTVPEAEDAENEDEVGVPVYAPRFRRVASIRCSARSRRTGEPCGRYAIQGGTVCPTHGGSAPAVKAAARRRLQSLAPFATSVLAELASGVATDPSTGVPVAVPPGVRQRAADSLLKMSGAGAPAELDLAVSEGGPRPDLDAAIAAALARRNTEAPGHDSCGT